MKLVKFISALILISLPFQAISASRSLTYIITYNNVANAPKCSVSAANSQVNLGSVVGGDRLSRSIPVIVKCQNLGSNDPSFYRGVTLYGGMGLLDEGQGEFKVLPTNVTASQIDKAKLPKVIVTLDGNPLISFGDGIRIFCGNEICEVGFEVSIPKGAIPGDYRGIFELVNMNV